MYISPILASVGSDYTGRANLQISLNTTSPSVSVPLPIINDNVHEDAEVFAVSLTLSTPNARVVLLPATAQITILDDDDMSTEGNSSIKVLMC